MQPKKIFLIRHGQTQWNAEFRWQGHSDIPLNSAGVEQARGVAEALSSSRLDVILSSDLQRAMQTAAIISAETMAPVVSTDAIREVHVGVTEGLAYEEAAGVVGSESIELWRSIRPEDLDFAFPGGETKRSALKRALAYLESFLSTTPAKTVGVVSHGMLIRTILHHLFPWISQPLRVLNCSFFNLEYRPADREWVAQSGWVPEAGGFDQPFSRGSGDSGDSGASSASKTSLSAIR